MQTSSRPANERVRNKNNLLHVLYDPQFQRLKVIRKHGSHLATMGIPGTKGEHFLWPEEAVFLSESSAALILRSGHPLTRQDVLRILETKKVSWAVYATYCYLKRAGYVVIRPRESSVTPPPALISPSLPPPLLTRSLSFPSSLLDCFPSIISPSLLYLPQLHMASRLVPVELDSAIQPHASVLRLTDNASRRRSCRPRYWPPLSPIALSSSTWLQFSVAKRAALAASRSVTNNNPSSSNVHFEAHLPQTFAHTRPQPPLFRILCHDARAGRLDFSRLSALLGGGSLVISIFDQGKVNFIDCSGASIDMEAAFQSSIQSDL